jgi:inorganic pyrophosphatase
MLMTKTMRRRRRNEDETTMTSLKEMVPPGAMVIFTPLLTGIFFGVTAVSGLPVGALVAAVQPALSMSNSGSAWGSL